jgi:hypothetical protein
MVEFEEKIGMFDENKIKQNYLGILYQSKISSHHPESYVK